MKRILLTFLALLTACASAFAEPIGNPTCDAGTGTLTQDIYQAWTHDRDAGFSTPLASAQQKMICSQVYSFSNYLGNTAPALPGCLPGQAITSDGGTAICINPSFPNRYPTDSNDLIVLPLGDSSSPLVNAGSTGSAGNLDNTYNGGTTGAPSGNLIYGARGFLTPTALFWDQQSSTLTIGINGSSSSTIEPANLTISVWINIQKIDTHGNVDFLSKSYRPDGSGWSSPFVSAGLGFNLGGSGNNLVIFYGLTVGGTNSAVSSSSIVNYTNLIQNQWSFIVATYDGNNQTLYINGELAATQNRLGGAIDYGTHGRWSILSPHDNPLSYPALYLNDFRVASVARSAAWVRTVYRQGVGLSW